MCDTESLTPAGGNQESADGGGVGEGGAAGRGERSGVGESYHRAARLGPCPGKAAGT